ncbi:MAG: MFS transporter [Gammaproteobacteria bacterium]|nr:MFS transporter [Gammaproteobacteria bacterium]
MSESHHETAPSDRIRLDHKLAYGLGSLTNNILAAASGNMMIVLNLAYGMNPALVSLLGSIPRLTDALTDPLMGYISDNTRTRWGRRRPYLFVGSIAASLIFVVLWQIQGGMSHGALFVYFLVVSLFFFLAYTVFATPWVALGYELTADYHERVRLMGIQNFIGQLAFTIAPWFLAFMTLPVFADMAEGASWLSIVVAIACILTGIVPALVLRERFADFKSASSDRMSLLNRAWYEIWHFAQGFKTTVVNRDFLLLAGATFLVFNGFQLIASFQTYVMIFYLYGGDSEAAGPLIGWFGTVSSIATFAVIVLVTLLAPRIGKRSTFFVCIAISTVGYASKWFLYSVEYPYLVLVAAPLIAFGLGSLFTLMGSMIADVCDVDELKTGERREGMYGSVFWWVVKLGMALAIALGGFLLNATGFDVELGGDQSEQSLFLMRVFDVLVPTVSSICAIALIYAYGITESKAYEIRAQLENRRGKL